MKTGVPKVWRLGTGQLMLQRRVGDDDEAGGDGMYCVACNKAFKSEKQYAGGWWLPSTFGDGCG